MLWELLRYPSDDARAQLFWRRRMSVLAVVGVVALLLVVLMVRGGGGSDSLTPAAAERPGGAPAPSAPVVPAGSASATPGATPGASAGPDASASPSASPSASATPSATPTRDPATTCAPGSMALRVASDAPSYAAGVQPTLTLSVVDVGNQPCVVDLGTTATSLSVLSAGKQVWSSSACADKVARPVQLTPAAAQMLTLRWDRTRNLGSCSSPSALPAGQYEIVARVGNAAVYGGSLTLA